MRIALMVIRLILFVPYYFGGIWWHGVTKNYNFEKAFAFVKHVAQRACHAGRVRLAVEGLENLPKENGFVLTPNHQGLFDALVFLATCPNPFTVVIKKEASNIILLKQVVKSTGSLVMDREDIRQSMQVINIMTEEVKKGRNYVIFPEGTRSKLGNKLLDFKPGSFKSAVRAKAPIVPCAIMNAYIPFDENHTKPVTVKLFYLKPMYYEEYKNMKTSEIAMEVKRRIEETIAKNS